MMVIASASQGRPVRSARPGPSAYGAFSLIELMIAIVILGLGMVMIATMFPVAMGRVRTLTDATRKTAIIRSADNALRRLTHVDTHAPQLGFNGSSFAGDLMVWKRRPQATDELLTLSDTRVHLLHMENIRVAPNRIVPDRMTPWLEAWAPWHLDGPDFLPSDSIDVNFPPTDMVEDMARHVCGTAHDFCDGSFFAAQIRIEDRVYPPIRPRDNVLLDGSYDGDDPNGLGARWDDLFNTRKYAWAALHRLDKPVGPVRDGTNVTMAAVEQRAVAAASTPRSITFYYVALRRPSPTQRYAVQDTATAPNLEYAPGVGPYLMKAEPTVIPKAMPAENDVVLPEPWRIQIQFPRSIASGAGTGVSGIPTEVQAPPPLLLEAAGASDAEMIMLSEMIQPGAEIIDEVNGQIYRVVKRRLDPSGTSYFLTLDREITLEDLEQGLSQDPNLPRPCDTCVRGQLDDEELLRTVWVFPPPVVAARVGNGIVAFDGPQPVIGIETRTVQMVPLP
ncbi:MAG: type II secretion system protein J [Phycisphaerae bacterium]